MKKIVAFTFLSLSYLLQANAVSMNQTYPVRIVSNGSNYCSFVQKAFLQLGVPFELSENIVDDGQHLFILFDVFNLADNKLPQYFIAYQTLAIEGGGLSNDYRQKLSRAVAVWDYSKNNIKKYENIIQNYYYFPENYEYTDPVILPCLLPVVFLKHYKEILSYSNAKNTDISSHLPAIFCYGVLQSPRLILEVGISSGESTKALHKVTIDFNADLLGIDIEKNISAPAYSNRQNATFLCMDDRNFTNYLVSSKYSGRLFEIIFIDTSHEYAHTMLEIKQFEKLLAPNGIMMFHDSNVTPYTGGTSYTRINDTIGHAVGNTRGVTQAIKEHFALKFDEYHYFNQIFDCNGASWHIIHYPFCNGLTVIRLLERH